MAAFPTEAQTGERQRFTLRHPEGGFDPRVTAIRSDLADIALAGQLFAPHYAEPIAMRCIADRSTVWDRNHRVGEPVSELLCGETFMVLDISGDEAWGYCARDGYVGDVGVSDLVPLAGDESGAEAVVGVRLTALYDNPDARSAVRHRLPLGARLALGEPSECGRFVATPHGFVPQQHLADMAEPRDAAGWAELLLGTPYVWGGRSAFGIDCSGLVQVALAMAGFDVPRDSDQQMAAIDRDLAEDAALQRGDLIFFPDHVGMMASEHDLIHATRHWMAVAREPLADVVARIGEKHDQPVLARKRIG